MWLGRGGWRQKASLGQGGPSRVFNSLANAQARKGSEQEEESKYIPICTSGRSRWLVGNEEWARLEMFTVILARDACGLRLANMTKELRANMAPVPL